MLNDYELSNHRVSTREIAYIEIKKSIISGELQPNQLIDKEELAHKLEVSRTPLREALQQLEFEELVVKQPNGRLKVASLSIQEAQEIFDVRGVLEGIVVRQATDNATERDIQYLTDVTHLINEAIHDGRLEDIIYYGSQFHSYLYRLSNNKTIFRILTQLNDHISRYKRLVPLKSSVPLKGNDEDHQSILKFIINKDKEGAELAMRKHIKKSKDIAIREIEKLSIGN